MASPQMIRMLGLSATGPPGRRRWPPFPSNLGRGAPVGLTHNGRCGRRPGRVSVGSAHRSPVGDEVAVLAPGHGGPGRERIGHGSWVQIASGGLDECRHDPTSGRTGRRGAGPAGEDQPRRGSCLHDRRQSLRPGCAPRPARGPRAGDDQHHLPGRWVLLQPRRLRLDPAGRQRHPGRAPGHGCADALVVLPAPEPRLVERVRAVRRHAAVRGQPRGGVRRGAHATPVQRLDLAPRHPRLHLLPGVRAPRDARGGCRSRGAAGPRDRLVGGGGQPAGFDPVLPRRRRGVHAADDRQRHRRRTRQLGDVRRRRPVRGGRGHPGFRQANSDKNGGIAMTTLSQSAAERLYGNRFLTERAPATAFPQTGMRPVDAMRLVAEDLALEGDPQRNLATFVTTWMEPEAQRIIAENLHRNFIDHAEYPISAEIEQRCVRMLADLFNAPGETTGCRTQGSSEAIMLGALSLKWKWKERREAANLSTDRPNLVFGGDVHVVWEKFCRYFDVEPRIVPLEPHKFTIGPEDVEPHVDENTIGVAAVLGTTFTGHADDIVGINDLLLDVRNKRDLDIPMHVDGASGGFVWPFLYPDSPWDFRLEQVRSINVSGHKFGLVYPGIGWLVFRETSDLPEDLVFYENYLGKRDATFTLNFSTGASMVLSQYYNFVRYGFNGYRYIMQTMQANARALADDLAATGYFEIIGGSDEEQLPLVAFKLNEKRAYDEFDIAVQLAAERGWMVPAYTLPPNADHVTIMRALVKQTLGHGLVTQLADDIAAACRTLDAKGGLHELDRRQVRSSAI